jgi:hypothetical protein
MLTAGEDQHPEFTASRKVYRESAGTRLDERPWTHYVTLTFQYQPSKEEAVREYRGFVRRLEQRVQRRIYHYPILERGASGFLHIHCLIAGTESLPISAIQSAWRCGLTSVEKYYKSGGAAQYLCKTTELAGDLDFCLSPLNEPCPQLS